MYAITGSHSSILLPLMLHTSTLVLSSGNLSLTLIHSLIHSPLKDCRAEGQRPYTAWIVTKHGMRSWEFLLSAAYQRKIFTHTGYGSGGSRTRVLHGLLAWRHLPYSSQRPAMTSSALRHYSERASPAGPYASKLPRITLRAGARGPFSILLTGA